MTKIVKDKHLVGNCHDNKESVIEGPLDVRNVFSNQASLRNWLESVNLISLASLVNFVVIAEYLAIRNSDWWDLGIMGVFCVDCKRVLVFSDYVQGALLLLLLL